MATRKATENDVSLPFAALQLLAPPVRVVSAALWKVLKQRDVMQYGVVEEFVTSACENIPGLLTMRHQGKLALGLRARLILELCRAQPDVKVIQPHLERICTPAAPSSSSASTVRKDVKMMKTIKHFHSLVHTLLAEPAGREQFFKEEFPVEYGPKFDQELEKLLWEFLIRLDQLLPVPNLAQTVSWLSDAPSVLEECAQAATQPQLLEILLQHQSCLGHLESAASLPPNMGDSILASLSLPLSGRVASKQPTGAIKSSVNQFDDTQTRGQTRLVTPVFGLISSEDVPIMISASKRTLRNGKPADSKDATNEQLDPKENLTSIKQKKNPENNGVKEGQGKLEEKKTSSQSSGMKRKQLDTRESESSEEEDVLGISRPRRKRISRQRTGNQKMNERTEDGVKIESSERRSKEIPATIMTQLGVKIPHGHDPSLSYIFASCLSNQPRVIIERLPVASVSMSRGRIASSFKEQRTSSPVKALTHKQKSSHQTSESQFPGLDDKENLPVPSVSSSPSQQRSTTEMLGHPGDGDDYVADSEDEATKNFKGRLFMKRYIKTKHGTYVPTLREFWKPGMSRNNFVSAGSKRR